MRLLLSLLLSIFSAICLRQNGTFLLSQMGFDISLQDLFAKEKMRDSILKALSLALPTVCIYCTLSSIGISAGRDKAWLFSDGNQYVHLLERGQLGEGKREVEAQWVSPQYSRLGRGWLARVDETTYVHLAFEGQIMSASFSELTDSCRLMFDMQVDGKKPERLEASCVSF